MKTRLTRIFCLLMAMQVLFMSTGFSMIEHYCKIKGKQTFIFTKPPQCCANKIQHKKQSSTSVIKKKKCCEEHKTFLKITTNASHGHDVAQGFAHHDWIDITPKISFISIWASEAVSFQIPHRYSPAPPLSGRNLLVFIQSFLI
ncbi:MULTISPECIES: HYC_CC_PP family protein [unclassified Arcicella]|uniref:HYC_CC_PP family protein n=1 Tax=unclassified Arcicella TaxID=2644986 RepID=UPI002859C59C|nr:MULTISPECIES: hypothetical protein [unclassified Arcicella]MDR6563830.1 hypothetical protein [Arcicella sp. BE51]MDR6813486.1 hypothetical protein [Arcicella sp. BE140]MDR6824799.1 hypothetical protein [Arcicella sp. BE139]